MPASAASSFDPSFGIAQSAATQAGLYGTGAGGAILYGTGLVYAGAITGGSNQGTLTASFPANGVICVAADMDTRRIWFRVNNGNWNNNASNSPTDNVGGVDISAALAGNAGFPFFLTNGAAFTVTANFGNTAFVQAMPSGFSATGSTSSGGTTSYYVDNAAAGGGNGTSWATAWNSLAAVNWATLGGGGKTLYISGGTTSKAYNETFTIGTSGVAGNPLIITRGVDAGHNGEPIIRQGGSANWGLICESRSYVTMSNFAVENSPWGCFRLRFNTRDVIIDGCRVYQPNATSADSPRGYDLRSNVTSGAAGTWAVILRNSSAATAASTQSQVDCAFTQDNDGLLIENCSLICHNADTFGHSDGWQSFQDINVTFRNNLVNHPNGGNDNHGLWLENTRTGGTLTVYNNIITRGTANPTYGLSHNRQATAGTGFDGRALIYNNTIYNGFPALHIWNAPLTEAKNNIVHYIPGGIGVDLVGTLTSTPSMINNNLVHSTSGTVARVGGTNRTWAQYQGLGYDTAGVNAAPMLTNPTSGDFTTQSGSPARNAGQTIALVPTDYAGISRPQGAAYDIGAYEFT